MTQSRHPEFGQNRFSIALVDGLKNIVDPGVYAGFKVVVVTATFNIEIKNQGAVGRAKTTSGVVIEDNDTTGALDTIAVPPTPNIGETRIIVAIMQYTHALGAAAAFDLVLGAQTAGTPVKPVIPTDAIELASWELPQTAASMDDAVNFANVVEHNVAGQPLASGDATNISDIVLTGADGGSEDRWSRTDHSHNHGDLGATPTGSPHDAGQVGFAPTTGGDWSPAPADGQDALDQIGGRLTTSTPPSDVGTAAVVGSSLDASRANHVHDHGDISGAAVTHHDSGQVENTQANPAAWSTSDGGSVKAHLDELAGGLVAGGTFATKGLWVKWVDPTVSEVTLEKGLITTLYDEVMGSFSSSGSAPTKALGVRYTAALTADVSSQGALGRDTVGAMPTNDWAGLYAIGDTTGSNSPSIIVSIDLVNGPLLPGGYDVFRLMSVCGTDGSGDFFECQKTDTTTMYFSHKTVFSAAPPITTMGGITVASFIPTKDLGDLIGHYGCKGLSASNTNPGQLWLAHGIRIGSSFDGYIAAETFGNFSGNMRTSNTLSVPTRSGPTNNIAIARNSSLAFTSANVYVNGWTDYL